MNLKAFQYKNKVFYRTTKPVPANRELMVYYGPSYAQDLGIDPNQQLTVYQLFRNPGEYSTCSNVAVRILTSFLYMKLIL